MIIAISVKGQLLVNLQLPPSGVVQKPQLWNMTVTNTTSSPMIIHVEVMMSDINSSMQVLSAITPLITIPPGTTQVNSLYVNPIQYNTLSPEYVVDPNPNGLLPVGRFDVCYTFLYHHTEFVDKIGEQCESLIVEPVGPPQLIFPLDGSQIESTNPQFNWVGPMPANLYSNLSFDLDLVEVYPNQQPGDAIQQNIPIMQYHDIKATAIGYPVNGQQLERKKTYAWRITAKTNTTRIAETETWSFTVKENASSTKLKANELPFAKLSRVDRDGYMICVDDLKFDYLNETGDRYWNLRIVDLSEKKGKMIGLNMDSIPLKPGQNLIRVNLSNQVEFIPKHLYQLEVVNSRHEVWRLKFEYRRSEN